MVAECSPNRCELLRRVGTCYLSPCTDTPHLKERVQHEPRRILCKVHKQRLETDPEPVAFSLILLLCVHRCFPFPLVSPRKHAVIFFQAVLDSGQEAWLVAAKTVHIDLSCLEHNQRIRDHSYAVSTVAHYNEKDRVHDLKALVHVEGDPSMAGGGKTNR